VISGQWLVDVGAYGHRTHSIFCFCISLGDALSMSKKNASLGRKTPNQATGIPLGMHPFLWISPELRLR